MFSIEDLEQISASVCRDMLGLNVQPRPIESQTSNAIVAAIRISGDWNTILEISTTPRAAQLVAQSMCGLTSEEMSEADIKDALGEIANMIGGNIKGALPGDSKLSLPCVGDHDQFPSDAQTGLSIDLSLEEQPFRVSMDTPAPANA